MSPFVYSWLVPNTWGGWWSFMPTLVRWLSSHMKELLFVTNAIWGFLSCRRLSVFGTRTVGGGAEIRCAGSRGTKFSYLGFEVDLTTWSRVTILQI
jgi:hypothetical protein